MSRNPKIYVSYAWQDTNEQGENREKIVDEIQCAVDSAGYKLIRDKEGGVGFGLRISKFMQEIGKGDLVIIVVSNKYLRSKNCMYEVVQIFENKNFPDKVTFVVLPDADLFDSSGRSQYLQYWLGQRNALEDLVERNSQKSYFEELALCTKVLGILDPFMATVGDINTLNVELLREHNFAQIVSAIHNVCDEINDSEVERVANFLASESINDMHPNDIEQMYEILDGYKPARQYSGFANFLWLILYYEYSARGMPPIRLQSQLNQRISEVCKYTFTLKDKEFATRFLLRSEVAKQLWRNANV